MYEFDALWQGNLRLDCHSAVRIPALGVSLGAIIDAFHRCYAAPKGVVQLLRTLSVHAEREQPRLRSRINHCEHRTIFLICGPIRPAATQPGTGLYSRIL